MGGLIVWRLRIRFTPRIMQIASKPNGLEAKGPRNDSGLKKNMQIPWKPNGLEAKDPKKDFGFTSKIMQIPWNQMVWRIRIRTLIFPRLHLYRELEAFVDSCLIRGPSIWTLTGLDRYSSALFCNFNLFWPLLTFSDNCANLTFFHFHNSVGSCNHIGYHEFIMVILMNSSTKKP